MDLADLNDEQQVALLVETTNDLGTDEGLPQPPQDPDYHADEHRLGKPGQWPTGEAPETAVERALRRADTPLEQWEVL